MEILKTARNIAIGGVLGSGLFALVGTGCNVIFGDNPAEVKRTIEQLKKEQKALLSEKDTLRVKIGETCFNVLDPVFEGGMGFDQAVADLAANADETVCGKTEDAVRSAVQEVSELEANLGAKSTQINDANTDLGLAESDQERVPGFALIGGLAGAGLSFVLSRQIVYEDQ